MKRTMELRDAYLKYQEARKIYLQEQRVFLKPTARTERFYNQAKDHLNQELKYQGWAQF